MAESPTIVAARAKFHEKNFPVWHPGLMDVPTNSKFLTCVGTQPPDLFCERRPHVNPDGVMVDWSAIIVEMKAALKPEPAFYFTFDGDRHEPGFEAEAGCRRERASCWLGPPAVPPAVKGSERSVWSRGLHALDALGKEQGGVTSELVQTWRREGNATDTEMLQVYWAPSDIVREVTEGTDQDPMSYMPVYDSDNHQCAFKTLADVPFESDVRVRFTLRRGGPTSFDGAQKKPYIIAARLLSMHIL